jgi:hypothetical protein
MVLGGFIFIKQNKTKQNKRLLVLYLFVQGYTLQLTSHFLFMTSTFLLID